VQVARRQVQLTSFPAVFRAVQPHSPLRQSEGLFGLQGSPTPAGAQVPLLRHVPLQHWSSRRHAASRPRQAAAAACSLIPSPASAAATAPTAPHRSTPRLVPPVANARVRVSNSNPSMVALLDVLESIVTAGTRDPLVDAAADPSIRRPSASPDLPRS
jgi:hypothetical protein